MNDARNLEKLLAKTLENIQRELQINLPRKVVIIAMNYPADQTFPIKMRTNHETDVHPVNFTNYPLAFHNMHYRSAVFAVSLHS